MELKFEGLKTVGDLSLGLLSSWTQTSLDPTVIILLSRESCSSSNMNETVEALHCVWPEIVVGLINSKVSLSTTVNEEHGVFNPVFLFSDWICKCLVLVLVRLSWNV